MNTPQANSEVERKRKNIVCVCRHIVKMCESEDGQEEIDSRLDEAMDRLSEVHLLLKDSHDRAIEERERLEAEQIQHEMRKASAHVTRVHKTVQKSRVKNALANLSDKERRQLLEEFRV